MGCYDLEHTGLENFLLRLLSHIVFWLYLVRFFSQCFLVLSVFFQAFLYNIEVYGKTPKKLPYLERAVKTPWIQKTSHRWEKHHKKVHCSAFDNSLTYSKHLAMGFCATFVYSIFPENHPVYNHHNGKFKTGKLIHPRKKNKKQKNKTILL